MSSEIISIVSIDIGLKTFSMFKEHFDYTKAKTIKKPKQCYKKNGEATDEFEEYVLNVSKCGSTQFIEKKEFGDRIKVYKSIETNDNFRQTDGEHAMIDIYLLSLCKAFKGSFASSFTQHVLYLQEAWKIRPMEYKQYFF